MSASDRFGKLRLFLYMASDMPRAYPVAFVAFAAGAAVLVVGFLIQVGLVQLIGLLTVLAAGVVIGRLLWQLVRAFLTASRPTGDPVGRLWEQTLAMCFMAGVRELRLSSGVVRAHREGAWTDMFRLPTAAHAPLVSHLKAMAHLDPAQRSRQEGEARVTAQGREAVVTVIVEPTPDGAEEARVRFPEPPASGPGES